MELFMFVPELDQSLQNEDEHEFEEQLFQDKIEEEAYFRYEQDREEALLQIEIEELRQHYKDF